MSQHKVPVLVVERIEPLVIKPDVEREAYGLGRVVLKLVSGKFLITSDRTDFH